MTYWIIGLVFILVALLIAVKIAAAFAESIENFKRARRDRAHSRKLLAREGKGYIPVDPNAPTLDEWKRLIGR